MESVIEVEVKLCHLPLVEKENLSAYLPMVKAASLRAIFSISWTRSMRDRLEGISRALLHREPLYPDRTHITGQRQGSSFRPGSGHRLRPNAHLPMIWRYFRL